MGLSREHLFPTHSWVECIFLSGRVILYFNPSSACFTLRSSAPIVSRCFLPEKEEGAGKAGFFGESAKQMRLLVSVERYLQFGNCDIDGRLKYWVQRVSGERERERGWVLNRRSTYRGSKTANGKGSKLEKKVAVRLYLFFFRRDRVEFLLSA